MTMMVFALLFLHIHPVFVIFGGALLGIVLIKIKEKLGIAVELERKNQEKEEGRIHVS